MQPGSTNTRSRGFASMDANKQREIARKGGRAAHEKGTAHEFTADEARAAGRKGGERVSSNREHMSRIGRLGGKMSAGRRQQQATSKPESDGAGVESQGNDLSDAGQAGRENAPEVDVSSPPASQSV
jgi:general stress protein YciG